jgi:hypothetical protein
MMFADVMPAIPLVRPAMRGGPCGAIRIYPPASCDAAKRGGYFGEIPVEPGFQGPRRADLDPAVIFDVVRLKSKAPAGVVPKKMHAELHRGEAASPQCPRGEALSIVAITEAALPDLCGDFS